MRFVEGHSRDLSGNVVIRSKVASPSGRHGYERLFWPGIEVGLVGWERAHSQGNITGVESMYGIRYAPREVNQHFQRLGIERFIQDLFVRKPASADLWLTTVTSSHPRTLRLKEIQYRVDAVTVSKLFSLFEASIMVENRTVHPKIAVEAIPRHANFMW